MDRQILFPFATLAQPLEKTVAVSRSAIKEIKCMPKEAKEKKKKRKKKKRNIYSGLRLHLARGLRHSDDIFCTQKSRNPDDLALRKRQRGFASGVSRTAREVSFEGCPLPPEAPVLRGPSQRAPCISQRRVPYIQTHSGERHHRLVCETSLMPVYMSTDV